MSIQINRFEKKVVDVKTNGETIPVNFKNRTGVLIKDHTTDEFISYVNLSNLVKENNELADRIIETIESYIEEKENEQG